MRTPLLFVLGAAVASVHAQGTTDPVPVLPVVPTIGTSVSRTATIQLGAVILTLVPLPPQPPIIVAPGTHITILPLAPNGVTGPVQWYKDGKLLPATGATLEIAAASTSDSGSYSSIVTQGSGGSGLSWGSDSARVLVSAYQSQRLINFSTRARISAEQPTFVSGLAVEPGPSTTLVLIRAVGPTLSMFGIADPLPIPQLKVFDSKGNFIPPPTLTVLFPSADFAAQRVGAFPLPPDSKDVAQLYYLSAGTYTVVVSSGDGRPGTVLFEAYQVW